MTIVNAYGTEERMKNEKTTYMCPICNVTYGYIKDPDTLSMNLITDCIACKFTGRVAEFIPSVYNTLDFTCAVFQTVEYKKRIKK